MGFNEGEIREMIKTKIIYVNPYGVEIECKNMEEALELEKHSSSGSTHVFDWTPKRKNKKRKNKL